MPGFYVLAVAVFAIPLSLLIGIPFWWAQCLVYASLAWSFVTSGGVYKIGAPAAAVLALGYGLRGLTTVDTWGQFPWLAHIPDPFLLMGIFGLLYLLTKLPYRSKNTWPGWLFIVMSILVTIFFYLGIFEDNLLIINLQDKLRIVGIDQFTFEFLALFRRDFYILTNRKPVVFRCF